MLDPETQAKCQKILDAMVKHIMADIYDRMICHGESMDEAWYYIQTEMI